MTNRHYEFTGETRVFHGETLNRIRATRDLPIHDVSQGDLGGWIKSYDNLGGNAWVGSNARVGGNARVRYDAQVGDDAQVTELEHVLTVGPIGSEGCTATLHRTVDGHLLHVGCWNNGSLDDLMSEVERRRAWREASPEQQDLWMAQYRAFHALGVATVAGWSLR